MFAQLKSKTIYLVATAAVAFFTGCKETVPEKALGDKKASNQVQNAQLCGTNMIVDNPTNKNNSKSLLLNIRPQICGRVLNTKNVWSALGKGVVTGEIYLASNKDAIDAAKKYLLTLKGKEVIAIHGNEQVKVGILNQNKHGYPMTLEKGILAQIGGSAQEGYDLDTKMVAPKDPRVFFIMESSRKK